MNINSIFSFLFQVATFSSKYECAFEKKNDNTRKVDSTEEKKNNFCKSSNCKFSYEI